MWSNVFVWFGYVTLPHVELLLKAKDYVEKKKMDIVQKRLERQRCAQRLFTTMVEIVNNVLHILIFISVRILESNVGSKTKRGMAELSTI